jgi:hypothetical protein
MQTHLVSISKVKPNQDNPRIIKDYKFKKLVQSIKDFPQMLELRPIVVNEDNIVLGGNMRLKACQEAGLKEVHIIQAKDLTPEQQREFIIKDNVGFGEWDWDVLANEWDSVQLDDWGMPTWLNLDDTFNIEEENNKSNNSPKITDDEYSSFELVMEHKNKIILINVINKVKDKYYLEKIEDALMHIINEYKI